MDIVDLVFKALEDINSSINFDTQNVNQQSPLHAASTNKSSNVAIHLLERYPQKINVLGLNGMHLLHYACQNGHLELLKYIFANSNLDIDLNVVDPLGWTPLHSASWCGQYETVRFILEHHEKKGIDILRKNNSQRTAEDLTRHPNIKELFEIWTFPLKMARVEQLKRKHNYTEEDPQNSDKKRQKIEKGN